MRTIHDVVDRLRAEFLEMPGLRLRSEQVQRLCGVERGVCQTMLDSLVDAKFLCVRDGHCTRLTGTAATVLDTSRVSNTAHVKKDETGATADEGMKGGQKLEDSMQDWHITLTYRPNVLVTGPADAVEQWLAVLIPHLDPPIYCWTPDRLLPSPQGVKTLMIRNVDALSAEQQGDVLSWLEQVMVAGTRVVSTTTVPLFQRVAAGLFLDVLYYRLNTVTLSGTDAPVTDGAAIHVRSRRRPTSEATGGQE